jgi:hypothetical protein
MPLHSKHIARKTSSPQRNDDQKLRPIGVSGLSPYAARRSRLGPRERMHWGVLFAESSLASLVGSDGSEEVDFSEFGPVDV